MIFNFFCLGKLNTMCTTQKMFFYLFSFLSQSNNTNINNFDQFIDLELGLKENVSLSTKNNKNLPTIIIHRFHN